MFTQLVFLYMAQNGNYFTKHFYVNIFMLRSQMFFFNSIISRESNRLFRLL